MSIKGASLVFGRNGARNVEDGWGGIIDAWLKEGTKSGLCCTLGKHVCNDRYPPRFECWRGSDVFARVSG